ncbi:MAG: glutathione binding-like protein [Sandaracinaceae bacterium]
MMQLYFAPLACSLVPRIVAAEMGIPLALRQVELWAATLTEDETPYADVTPLALVPVLVREDGERLTEVQAIVQYLADRAPERGLLAPVGSLDRYRTIGWCAYFATEVHKRIFWRITKPGVPHEGKAHAHALGASALDHLEAHMAGRRYVATDAFTIADAYLAWVLAVAPRLRIAIGDRPHLNAYWARMMDRPSVAGPLNEELALLPAALERQAALRT